MKDRNKLITLITAIIIAISSIFIYKGAIAPKLYDKYLNTGIKFFLDGQYQEAILAFDKAIKIEPKTTEARVYQAKAYVGNKEIDKAVEMLEEAQSIDMPNEELLKEILEILKEIDSDIAYEFLDRFIEAVGKDNVSQEINDIFNLANEIPSEPVVDPAPGTYVEPISVKLKLDELKLGHSYYYTLDGTDPNKGSEKYRDQIEITESTTIKLIGYNKNDESSEVITLEYIIDNSIISEIEDKISEAEALINKTDVGSKEGNISKVNKDEFLLVIKNIKDSIKNTVDYNELRELKNKINNSIKEFKNNIIKPELNPESTILGKFIIDSNGSIAKKFGTNTIGSGYPGLCYGTWEILSKRVEGNTIYYKCKTYTDDGDLEAPPVEIYENVTIKVLNQNTISMQFGSGQPYETLKLLNKREFVNAGGDLGGWE